MIPAIYRSAVCHNRESARPLTLPTASYLNSAQGGARKCALFPRRNHPRDSKAVKINVTTVSAFNIRLTCARVFCDLGFTNKKERGGCLLIRYIITLICRRRKFCSNYPCRACPRSVAQSAYSRKIFLAREHTWSFRILCAAREITSERSRCFDYLPRNYSASRWGENIAIVKDFISVYTLRFSTSTFATRTMIPPL